MHACARRRIEKGSEVLYDYGIGYWRVCLRSLMQAHAEFAATTQHACAGLEQHLRGRRITPPSVTIPGVVQCRARSATASRKRKVAELAEVVGLG